MMCNDRGMMGSLVVHVQDDVEWQACRRALSSEDLTPSSVFHTFKQTT